MESSVVLLVVAAVVAGALVGGSLRPRHARERVRPPLGDRASQGGKRPRPRTSDVLDALDEGVIVFDDTLSLQLVNRAARSILNMSGPSLPARLAHDELLSLARRSLSGGEETTGVIEVGEEHRTTVAVRAAPRSNGDGVVITLRDTSREELVHRMRRQFVSHASHELKTPVASIRTLAEAIESAARDDPVAAGRMASRLTQEAERLGDLIHDLLELARLEEPAAVTTRTVNLSDVLAQQVREMNGAVTQRSLAIMEEITPGVLVRGDDKQLAVMIRNLLDNAVRYSNNGGTIVVRLRRSAHGDVELQISDEGIGIPLRDQTRIFERFYRVDEARARDSGGTGLGLAIVKHVASLHGGRVSVTSAVDEGSTFTVQLPSAPVESPDK